MTNLSDLPLRDDLVGQLPYGAPQAVVPVALNVNENTHAVPEGVARHIVESLAAAVLTINRYPDREFTELRGSLAAYLDAETPGADLTEDNIWAANGANEVLQAFGGPGRSVLGFTPTYSMYPLLASGTGTRYIAGARDENYAVTPELAVQWIEREKPDIVILCAPNNPTGTPLYLETVEAAYAASTGIVVVDEAYFEFAPTEQKSAVSLLEGRERLLVSRTMSKAFAFAGVRLGYLAADPAVTDALRLVRLPYHLSALTQAAATAALRHAEEMLAMVDDIREQRDRIVAELPALGYTPLESWANFVLFGGVDDPHATFEALLEHDIIIRDVGIPNHLRVTAGTKAETTAFLKALASLGDRA